MSPVPVIPSSELSPAAIAAGGEHLEILDAKGERQRVLVRLLKIAELGDYVARADNEQALCELLLGLPAGAAADLPPLSILQVNEVGHDLNFSAACLWAARRAKIAKAALAQPEIMEEVMKKILIAASANSVPSSPASSESR